MINILVGSVLGLVVSTGILFISLMIYLRVVVDREKSSSYECGFDPMSSARLPFSLRFFLLAVIFLIFDVEIVLLFPLFWSCFMSMSLVGVFGGFFFLIVLLGGLFHEWREGSLDWMN
uniref:NADH-ubiquinone oxidoreductase chain 3 n=1 Tax=Georissa bangueyensis TaxID=1882664 RepID=A0A1B2G3C7_9GAST|nr:NADH dehydrogenase subunit 3 [Georissa bangueyensis]